MKIILNNREEIIEKDTLSLSELIEYKNFSFKLLVTKVNDRLIKKDERDTYQIMDGDQVAVIHLVSGG
jgi:thiamine biosynthesis protein ThiS